MSVIENKKVQQPVAQLHRGLTLFTISPNTNQRTDFYKKLKAVFIVRLHYQSVIIKWHT